MPSYKTTFGSWLKTEDLGGTAQRVVVEGVTLETIKGHDGEPDSRKLVAKFKGKDKALILNKTRCEQLETIMGDEDYEAWAGPVMLVPGTTKFGGKTVGCINIEVAAVAGKPKPAPVEDVTDSDVPF
jgi:hypothetical protein